MRVFCFLILVLVIGALAIFVVQNEQKITIRYFNLEETFPLALGLVAVYFLGMISGWTVVGMLKRSWRRVTEQDDR
jgi:uncharacterized integral membrane protein